MKVKVSMRKHEDGALVSSKITINLSVFKKKGNAFSHRSGSQKSEPSQQG
jgi:hypothetical protein